MRETSGRCTHPPLKVALNPYIRVHHASSLDMMTFVLNESRAERKDARAAQLSRKIWRSRFRHLFNLISRKIVI